MTLDEITDDVEKQNARAEGDASGEDAADEDSGVTEQDADGRGLSLASENSDIAVFNRDVEILIKERLPYLDKGDVKAYVARIKGEEGSKRFFVMICERHLTPSSSRAHPYMSVVSSGLPKMISSGPVFWPPSKSYQYCFMYENSLGRPLISEGEELALGVRQDVVLKKILSPLINVLLDLRDASLVHGDIRATNLFDGGAKDYEKIMLGECLSAPCSYSQPSIYLPIDRIMCDPVARGRTNFDDDLYAFGVTLVVLLRKKDPLKGLDDEAIIREKIEHGSYTALVGNERLSGALLELLRGVLYDDVHERWGLEDIRAWLEGQRLSPKQSSKMKKASRPLAFEGEKHLYPALLVDDMAKNPEGARQILQDGSLDQWLLRSLEDNMVEDRLEEVLVNVQNNEQSPVYTDLLVSGVSMALDTKAPLRFKGMNLHPEGIETALAQAFVLNEDLAPFAEIINYQLVQQWTTVQNEGRVDVGSLLSRFDNCKSYLRQKKLGYGMERCLYHLNPDAPCLSERLSSYYVTSPEDLLYALEDISKSPDRPEMFVDRHIAAFLSVKDRQVIDPYWGELNSSDRYRRILGNLKVVATIQLRSRLDSFPGVSQWISELLPEVYDHYHDRELRKIMAKKIEKLKETGDLTKIIAIFDNNSAWSQDHNMFKEAMLEYVRLGNEYIGLEEKLEKPEEFGRETGKEIAAIFSGFLAGIIIITVSFIFFMEKGFF